MKHMDPYAGPWTADHAAHLARRAGFGAQPNEIAGLTRAGMNEAVDDYVDFPAHDSMLEVKFSMLPMSGGHEGKLGSVRDPYYEWDLQNNWVFRMIHTSQPLQEVFTLFLHDTLVSDWQKVWATITELDVRAREGGGNRGALTPWTQKIIRWQYDLFREKGLGSYRQMLRAIVRDPAMQIYLDNRLNTKDQPQENLARELMELFSMGVGNYSEQDVREIARVLTGEKIDESPKNWWPMTPYFDAAAHDKGPKSIFGKTVHSDKPGAETNEAIDLILDRVSGADISPAHAQIPAASLYMAWKFINWFVLETIPIDHPAVAELGGHFYDTKVDGENYNVRETLRVLLKSRLFYDEANRYRMYKHPADYMVAGARNLELPNFGFESKWEQDRRIPKLLAHMGMNLFNPPNVSGWAHGRFWINTGNLIARFNLANEMSTAYYMDDAWCDKLIADGHVADTQANDDLVEYFRARLVQAPLLPGETAAMHELLKRVEAAAGDDVYYRKVRGCAHVMMTLPRYQLK